MNLNPVDFNYIDGENIYPLQDYIDEQINNIYTSNIYITPTKKLNEVIYYSTSNLNIQNNIPYGQIQFKTSSSYPLDNTKYGTIIDFTGKLQVYHNYNLLQPTFSAAYYDVEAELLQLKADGINTDAQFILIEAGAVYLQDQITSSRNALINVETQVLALTNSVYSGRTYQEFKNIVEDTNLLSFRDRYNTLIGGMAIRATERWQNTLINISATSAILGLAGACIGAAANYLSYEQASNTLYSNLNFTTIQKNTIYNDYISYEIQSYNNYNISMSNLNVSNGFINCNIITTQTIPLISTGNITVNYSSTGGHIKLYNTNSNANTAIVFYNNAGIQSYIGIGGTNITTYANNFIINSASGIIFSTGGQNNLMTPSMCIANTGATGLNAFPSTIPTGYRFYVNGNSYFNGSITTTSLTTNSIIYNTQELSTTLNSYLLKSGGTLTGPLTLNTSLYADPGPYPNGFNGDRIILNAGIGTNGYPYSVGINTNVFWNCAPATASYKWYSGATNTATLDNTGLLTLPSITTTANLNINGISKLANYTVIGYPYVDYNGYSQTSIFAGPSTAVNLILESRAPTYGACLLLTNNLSCNSAISVGGSTTSPTLFRNNMILQSATAIILNVNNTATETPNFIILQNGNTGIGIANPTTLFYVNGNSTLLGSVSGVTTLNATNINCSIITASNDTNPIRISSTLASANNCIQFKNNSTFYAYMGIGGTSFSGNYQNNFFIESTSNIILNANAVSLSTPRFMINSTGNIGIGTVPATTYMLDVYCSNPYGLRVFTSGTNGYIYLSGGTGNSLGYINFVNSAGLRQGYIGYGNNTANYIDLETENNFLGYKVTGNLIIAGNNNIGTDTSFSANTKLTISGSSYGYSQPLVRITQNAGWDGNYALQVVGYSDFGGIRINGADTGNTIYTTGNNDMGLSTNAGTLKFNVNGAERMRIATNGNVGIGTNNPGTKLDIAGVINLNSSGSLLGTPTQATYGGNGDRIILWNGDSGNYPYSLGMNNNTMWYSTPNGASHKFYTNGSNTVTFNQSFNIICPLISIAGIPNAWRINLNQYNIAGQATSVYFSCSHYNSTGPITIYWVGHILINSFNTASPSLSFSTIFNSTNCYPSWFYDGSLWLEIISTFSVTGSILKYKVIG